MTGGWEESAAAWIADMGEEGDFGRRFVLDPVMMERVRLARPATALDVGCGEGRFCRRLKALGIATTGLDPTQALLAQARKCDPGGDYVDGVAASLPFASGAFDLVVSYLSLIDIPGIAPAIAEMTRVLKPGGRLLIANLNAFNTAGDGIGWICDEEGNRLHFAFDGYLAERSAWIDYRGIRVLNYHRPLSTYMALLLQQGLRLDYFAEPAPIPSAPAERAKSYVRAPWFMVMEWSKP